MTATIPTCAWSCGQAAAAQAAADADLADKAADVIMLNGHHKGAAWPFEADGWWRPGLPVCLTGALSVALGWIRPLKRQPAEVAQHARVHFALTREIGTIPSYWNDRPDRTADDVIDALRRTAKTLRETPQQHDPHPHDRP